MADETTQTAPVAGTENATQNAEVDTSVKAQEESLKKNFPTLIGYLYMSDPDNTNPLWHHYVMPIFDEKAYENLPWHVYKERPSDDLVDPLYSVKSGGWIENAHDAQSQILAQAQAKIEALDKSKAELEQINRANAQQTQMITKQLGNQMTMMVQMQQTLAILAMNSQSTSQNGTQTTPVQPTTNPTVNTDTNGGNN